MTGRIAPISLVSSLNVSRGGLPQAGVPLAPRALVASLGVPVPIPAQPAAPARTFSQQIRQTAASVNEGLQLPGMRESAGFEASREAGAQVFDRLRGEASPVASGDGLLAEARDFLADLFAGKEYMAHKGRDAQGQLARLRERAAALPGRSIIYLEAPTAAGKSTLADNLKSALGQRVKVFPVDDYYKALAEAPQGKDGLPDFDRPEALHLGRAAADIQALLEGKRIELPRYDMRAGTFLPQSGNYMQLGPDEVLIVDSIYAAHDRFVRAGIGHRSLNVYLHAPAAVRLARRLSRDRTQRGVSVERNLRSWPHILEDEKHFILPLRARADMVLNLVEESELARLPETYAVLLAQEWAAEGRSGATAGLLRCDIAASLRADAGAAR